MPNSRYLTTHGNKDHKLNLSKSLQVRFDRLFEAATAYRKAKGKRDEEEAGLALCDLVDEMTR